MITAPVLPTFTYPGVNRAMLALSKARHAAFLARRQADDSGYFGRNHATDAAAASSVSARQYQAIVDRITRDLATGVYEGNRT